MAKIKDPFGAREARGSVGGITSARNTSGNYFRCKASPVQPRSKSQTTRRANFQQISYKFQNLTSEQIILWNDFGRNWPSTDAFGDSLTNSGYNWFLKFNLNLTNINQPLISLPPLTPSCKYNGNFKFMTVNPYGIGETYWMSNTNFNSNEFLNYKISALYPNSRTHIPNKWQYNFIKQGTNNSQTFLFFLGQIHPLSSNNYNLLFHLETQIIDNVGRASPKTHHIYTHTSETYMLDYYYY